MTNNAVRASLAARDSLEAAVVPSNTSVCLEMFLYGHFVGAK